MDSSKSVVFCFTKSKLESPKVKHAQILITVHRESKKCRKNLKRKKENCRENNNYEFLYIASSEVLQDFTHLYSSMAALSPKLLVPTVLTNCSTNSNYLINSLPYQHYFTLWTMLPFLSINTSQYPPSI